MVVVIIIIVLCEYWEDMCFMVCAKESEDNFGESVFSLHIPWVSASNSGCQVLWGKYLSNRAISLAGFSHILIGPS